VIAIPSIDPPAPLVLDPGYGFALDLLVDTAVLSKLGPGDRGQLYLTSRVKRAKPTRVAASCTGHEDRVPHISLVFREMWDTTVLDAQLCRLSLGAYPDRSHQRPHIQPAVFQAPDKAVILSEALRRSISNKGLYGAESKDPGDACWQMLLGVFRPQNYNGR
jgi:hypothetical protein